MKIPKNLLEIISGRFKKQIFQWVLLLLVLAGPLAIIFHFARSQIHTANEKKTILASWEEGSWEKAYEKSREGLLSKPMDSFFLTMNGFAAYQTALAQINNEDTLNFIDECILSLRRALLDKNADRDGRIRYVLGKAYYAKGPDYADLAVKYLEEAKTVSFSAGDFDEYLGLSYTALRDYRKSVEAFTASLDPENNGEESALLLLHIARSYMGLEEWETAMAYLVHCIEISKDADLTLNARMLLGKVLVNTGDEEAAIVVFESILDSGGENAEAAYELGEIYAARGETTRARAAWRRAYRANPNFAPAAVRLNAM